MERHSIYLHIPFCMHRCSYCDFNTYAGLEDLIPAYSRSLCHEIEVVGSAASVNRGRPLPVHTLFFGGGTPSLMPAEELGKVIASVRSAFELQSECEITLEANPGTLTEEYLQRLRRMGVNRLSIGMQSSQPGDLCLLERQHSFAEVIQSVTWARVTGFENLNLDLIFGLPYQSLESWRRTLDLAIGLRPEHLSLYALTLEHGTPMQNWVERGLLLEPDSDLAAEMYEWAMQRLGEDGYQQYEISNWARLDAQGEWATCRHNLQYWRNQPYLGFGAGAHGYAAGFRTANVLSPSAYIKRLQEHGEIPFPRSPATVHYQRVEGEAEFQETMMMGLRLVQEGVSGIGFERRYGISLGEVFGATIERLIQFGLLEWSGDSLRLTVAGRLLGNQVFMEFV